MEWLSILPAAFTMVAGPQIISAVVLTTSSKPRQNSVAYILGVAIAVSLGVLITFTVSGLLGGALKSSGGSDARRWLDYLFAALLAVASVHAFATRKTAKPPKWLTALQEADSRRAFRIGLTLFLVMPSDVIVMISVGGYLAKNSLGYLDSIPFILATLLLISLPLIAFLLMGSRATSAMPKLRDWMNANSWLIDIAVYVFFIFLFLS